MILEKLKVFVIFLLLATLLSACGGGTSSSSAPQAGGVTPVTPPPTTPPPVINTPTVTLISPQYIVNVSVTPTLQLQFSEAVRTVSASNVSLHVGSATGSTLPIGPISSVGNNTYAFSPLAPLSELTQYFIVVDNVVTNANGTPIPSTALNFHSNLGVNFARLGGIANTNFAIANGVDAQNNVYLAFIASGVGATPSSIGINDLGLTKFSSEGVALWTRQVGVPGANIQVKDMATDASGNSYIFGITDTGLFGQTQKNSTGFDYFVVKYNANGDVVWGKQYSANSYDQGRFGISVDPNGNSYISGTTVISSSTSNTRYFLIKLDSIGNLLWERQDGGASGATIGRDVSVDNSGNSYIIGNTRANLAGNNLTGFEDSFIAKYDTNGVLLWTKQFGTKDSLFDANSLATDADGNNFIASQLIDSRGFSQSVIEKLDTNGVRLWRNILTTGSESFFAFKLAIDKRGNSYITGGVSYKREFPANQTGLYIASNFIAKYLPDGTLQGITEFSFDDTSDLTGIAIDNANRINIIGNTQHASFFGQTLIHHIDYYLIQYRPN